MADVEPGRGRGWGVGSARYAPAMANFAVRLVHGPRWDSSRQIREQEGWDGHAAFMDGLVDDGFIVLGGPVGDGEQTLHVIEATDENEIRARLAGDPWASAGLLQIGTIELWALWLDSRGKNPAHWPKHPAADLAPQPDDARKALEHGAAHRGQRILLWQPGAGIFGWRPGLQAILRAGVRPRGGLWRCHRGGRYPVAPHECSSRAAAAAGRPAS